MVSMNRDSACFLGGVIIGHQCLSASTSNKSCGNAHVSFIISLLNNFTTMPRSGSRSKSPEGQYSDDETVEMTKERKMCNCRVCSGKLIAQSTWYKHRGRELQELAGEISEKRPRKKRKRADTVRLTATPTMELTMVLTRPA